MAEAFGIAAGLAGFVSLTLQVSKGLTTLHDIRNSVNKAPEELSLLLSELTFLWNLMQKVSDNKSDDTDFVIKACYESCELVVNGLKELDARLAIEPTENRKQRLRKFLALRHWKEDVEVLHRHISNAKGNFILAFQFHNGALLSDNMRMLQLQNHMLLNLTATASDTEATLDADINSIENSSLQARKPPKHPPREWDCTKRKCSCSCHSSQSVGGRFWFLDYTPMSGYFRGCDNNLCTASTVGAKLRFSLSKYSIPYSVVLQFHFLASQGMVLTSPSLQLERTVKYTSPGFVAIKRCSYGILPLDDARETLRVLFRSDSTFRNHVDPSGKSYIEALMEAYWRGPNFESDFWALLELFLSEFNMTKGMDNTRFLVLCVKNHLYSLELLKGLLDLGFDPTVIDSPQASEWPRMNLFNSIQRANSDFLKIKLQSLLVKDNQGFGGLSALHEAVLSGSTTWVQREVRRSSKDQKNFLGQTPLHFAIGNPNVLALLLHADHDVDARDSAQWTPLMYAAVQNATECAISLLKAGADASLTSPTKEYSFMDFANAFGNWNMIMEVLRWFKAFQEEKFELMWQTALKLYLTNMWSRDIEECILNTLLSMCSRLDFTFDYSETKGNTLLFYATSVSNIDLLLEHGFTAVTALNENGENALFNIIRRRFEPDAVQRLLDAGIAIEHKNNAGLTILHSAFRYAPVSYTDRGRAVQILRILITNGGDLQSTDRCKCPCSPNGCRPITAPLSFADEKDTHSLIFLFLWCLECLETVHELRGSETAKGLLLSTIRRNVFDQLEMTHVGCSCKTISVFGEDIRRLGVTADDVEEILEEESELAEALENETAGDSMKSYDVLLDVWMHLVDVSMQATEKTDRIYKSREPPELIIDEKTDTIDFDWWLPELFVPGNGAVIAITDYVKWIRSVYAPEGVPQDGTEGLQSDIRYNRRISLVRQFCDILEISQDERIQKLNL